jgi:hypothetical protein
VVTPSPTTTNQFCAVRSGFVYFLIVIKPVLVLVPFQNGKKLDGTGPSNTSWVWMNWQTTCPVVKLINIRLKWQHMQNNLGLIGRRLNMSSRGIMKWLWEVGHDRGYPYIFFLNPYLHPWTLYPYGNWCSVTMQGFTMGFPSYSSVFLLMYIIIYITKLQNPLLAFGARERWLLLIRKQYQNPPLMFEVREGVGVAIVVQNIILEPPAHIWSKGGDGGGHCHPENKNNTPHLHLK